MSDAKSSSDKVSQAKRTFDNSINDAKSLLKLCDSHPPLPEAEVFKRAGLVMALTAWETYVEDRIVEGVKSRLSEHPSHAEKFMNAKLLEEIKKFHNPTSDKTKKLFMEYLEIDVTAGWSWNGFDSDKARLKLDSLVKTRGDAVHRSKIHTTGQPAPHLVKKEDLEKAIKFFNSLVLATDKVLQDS